MCKFEILVKLSEINTIMSIFKIHGKKIWVAGHNGMVGKAVVRQLEKKTVKF